MVDGSDFVLISAVLPRLSFDWFDDFGWVVQKVEIFILS
jgi:hypothetical protein